VPATHTCGAVTLQDNRTVVTHTPRAATLSLTHAGNTYAGSGRPRPLRNKTDYADALEGLEHAGCDYGECALSDGGREFTLTVDGQFSRTGLDAMVHVAVRQQAASTTCAHIMRWLGTKSGPPNTFPS
jgi:hypothetical protein